MLRPVLRSVDYLEATLFQYCPGEAGEIDDVQYVQAIFRW